MKHLLDKTQLAMRKCKSHGVSLTAGTFKNQETMKDFIHQDIGYKFMKTLRGSPPYFEQVSKELMSMIRMLGPATFFCSFSAAETRWIHLLKILAKVVDGEECTDEDTQNMSWPEKARLIKSDPVTCARHFDYSVQCLLKFLKSQLQPIGDLIDYFLRVEFQHRGSPHIHMLVWIKNAPLLNTSSKEDIIDFIERNITCKRPEEKDGSNEEHNTLAELVKFQLHRHSHTCKKGNSRKCCFNILLPPMKETQILEPIDPEDDTVDIVELRKSWQKIQDFLDGLDLGSRMTFGEFLQKLNISEAQYILGIRSSLKQPTVFLRRTPWEIRVNAYNKHIILAWRAHMDIQYVMDVYACAKYVASYITKSQRGISELLRKASEEARTGNQDIPQQLRMVSNKFLNSVELSAQEAVYICLQLPMKKSSRQVVFISTNLPEDCVFLLKPNHVLQTMRMEWNGIGFV